MIWTFLILFNAKKFENIKVSLWLLQVKEETPIYMQLQFFCYKSKIHLTRKLVLSRSQKFPYQLHTNNLYANLMKYLSKNLESILIFSSNEWLKISSLSQKLTVNFNLMYKTNKLFAGKRNHLVINVILIPI